jgi:outer membrane beta-barrel protein
MPGREIEEGAMMSRSVAAVLCGLVLCAAPAARAEEPPATTPEAIERYWREKREVGVVQKRLFEKAGRVEAAVFAGWIPNDAFTYYVPVGARGTYFFTESWGVEVLFDYNLHLDTRLKELLHEQDASVRAQIRDRQQLRLAASAVWVPFYGKIAFNNRKLGHFDAFLLAGAGTVRTGASEIGLSPSFRPEANLGVGFRLHVTPMMAVKLEVRDFVYWAAKNPDGQEGGGLTQAWELGLSFALMFGRGK